MPIYARLLVGSAVGSLLHQEQSSMVLCAAGSHTALKSGLHAQLIRAVCASSALQAEIMPQLVSFLSVYSWSDAYQAAWLTSLIPDLVDAVQSTEGHLGGPILSTGLRSTGAFTSCVTAQSMCLYTLILATGFLCSWLTIFAGSLPV